MQRSVENACQAVKKMKRLSIAFVLLTLISCKKESNKWITATVLQEGCTPGSWIIKIDEPKRSRMPFLCEPSIAILSSSTTHCGNSAVILDLPDQFAQNGMRIKFSQWKDEGLLCFSSTLAPHHLRVFDIGAQ
jgi:hypothetical protein